MTMTKPQPNKPLLETAMSHNLADLVTYAEGGIVSRTLVDGQAGTLTLFAFDAGQGLSEHSAPFDAVVLLLGGRLELKIGGRPVQAAAGQIVIMPANVPHAVRAADRAKMLLTMFKSGT